MFKPKVVCLLLGMTLMMCGCRSSSEVNALGVTPPQSSVVAASTVIPLLQEAEAERQSPNFDMATTTESESAPTRRSAFVGPTVPTPEGVGAAATALLIPTPTIVPTEVPSKFKEVVVFDDKLNTNWSLAQSSNVDFDPLDTSHWYDQLKDGADSGAVSVAVTPLSDFGMLFFTVEPGTAVAYRREDIIGISLWINSGTDILDTDDLALTVMGSNRSSYWTADDFSVFSNIDDAFSETRIYYLGLNRAIPPDTWAQVILWLDDLLYDPDYSNVVGFYIKNNAGFRSTFYVENVTLLTVP